MAGAVNELEIPVLSTLWLREWGLKVEREPVVFFLPDLPEACRSMLDSSQLQELKCHACLGAPVCSAFPARLGAGLVASPCSRLRVTLSATQDARPEITGSQQCSLGSSGGPACSLLEASRDWRCLEPMSEGPVS